MRGALQVFLLSLILLATHAEAKLCEALVEGSDGKVLDLTELKKALRDDFLTKYWIKRINYNRNVKWFGPERPAILVRKTGLTYDEMLSAQRIKREKQDTGRDALDAFLDITLEVGIEQQLNDIMSSKDMQSFVKLVGQANTLTQQGKRAEALQSLRDAWTVFQKLSSEVYPEKNYVLSLSVQKTFVQMFEVTKGTSTNSTEITKEMLRILNFGRLQGQRLFAKQHVIIMKGALETMGGVAEKVDDDTQAGMQMFSHLCSILKMLNLPLPAEFVRPLSATGDTK